MRRASLLVALLAALALSAPGALAAVYSGAGSEDPKMEVTVVRTGRAVAVTYRNVRLHCTNGQMVRQLRSGLRHTVRLDRAGGFRELLELPKGSSLVRGTVTRRRAFGVVRYRLRIRGVRCGSGLVPWSARRAG